MNTAIMSQSAPIVKAGGPGFFRFQSRLLISRLGRSIIRAANQKKGVT